MGWSKLPPVTDKQLREFGQYKKKARFLIDESVGEAIARILQEQGWNAVFVGDVGLGGHSDENVFAFAWKDNRVLLTHDRDFLNDQRFPPHRTQA